MAAPQSGPVHHVAPPAPNPVVAIAGNAPFCVWRLRWEQATSVATGPGLPPLALAECCLPGPALPHPRSHTDWPHSQHLAGGGGAAKAGLCSCETFMSCFPPDLFMATESSRHTPRLPRAEREKCLLGCSCFSPKQAFAAWNSPMPRNHQRRARPTEASGGRRKEGRKEEQPISYAGGTRSCCWGPGERRGGGCWAAQRSRNMLRCVGENEASLLPFSWLGAPPAHLVPSTLYPRDKALL